MADESHVFGGLELNDGIYRKVLAHTFKPAQEKPDLVGGADSEGVVLARKPRPGPLEHEITVRIRQQTTWDAAGQLVAGIVQRAAECANRPDGLPHVWTPQGATQGFTAYVLHAQVTEVPISQSDDGAGWGWLDRSPVVKIALTCKPYWYLPEVEGEPVTSSDSVIEYTLSGVTGDVDAEGRIIITDAAGGGGGGGGGGDPEAAEFPSRLRVMNNVLVDENDVDIGIIYAFNTNVIGGGLPFDQDEYDDMTVLSDAAVAPGRGGNRFVIPWDLVETADGVYDGISSSTGAATAGSAFDKLDISIQRAYAAQRYGWLDLHLLDASISTGGGVLGRVPVWAQTGTLPSGSGNSYSWFCTNGQGIVETLAERYGDPATSPIGDACLAVIGFAPNEPPTITQDSIMDGHETFVPWYRDIVPEWLIIAAPFAYGGGTPYPSGAADVDLARLLALDPNEVGILLAWHTYLNQTGTASSDGYQANGGIDPVEQVTNGSEFYGWGTPYVYPDTAGSRADLAAHIAPVATLRDQDPRLALAAEEWGNDNEAQGASHDAHIEDTVNTFRENGVVVEGWWQWGNGTTNFDARPGGTIRAGLVSRWFGNTTPRVDP